MKKQVMIWKNEKVDNHFWAFFYFCKEKGDDLQINFCGNRKADLMLIKEKD